MKYRLLVLLAVLSMAASAADPSTPRVFDIVAPEGGTVEMVDGYSVIRQQGGKFGAVVGFAPSSPGDAWIPLAVLNTGDADLAVGTNGVSARQADGALQVWTAEAIAADQARHDAERDAALRARRRPRAPVNAVMPVTGPDARLLVTNSPGHPGTRVVTIDRDGDGDALPSYPATNAAPDHAPARAVSPFPEQPLPVGDFCRGEVRVDLPAPRADGQPAEFVLTLAFGGETMAVHYRERIAAAD